MERKIELGKVVVEICVELFGDKTSFGTINNHILFKLVPSICLSRYPDEENIYAISIGWLNVYLFLGYKFKVN